MDSGRQKALVPSARGSDGTGASSLPTLTASEALQTVENRGRRTRELMITPPMLGVTIANGGYLENVMTMRVRGAVGAVVLLAGLAACSAGGRGTPTGPMNAVETFEGGAQAAATPLPPAACWLPPPARSSSSPRASSCAKALPDQDIPAATSGADVEVYGDEAIARVAGDVLFLTNVGGTWMVSAAGCKPQPDEPYDCEVKGS